MSDVPEYVDESHQPPPPPPHQPDWQDRDACQWAMYCHLAGLCAYVPIVPIFGGIVGTLVVWTMKRDSSQFVDEQGKEALNFQISMTIYSLIAVLTVCIGVGIFVLPVLFVVNVVFIIIAALKASNGEDYRYPLIIRFVK